MIPIKIALIVIEKSIVVYSHNVLLHINESDRLKLRTTTWLNLTNYVEQEKPDAKE